MTAPATLVDVSTLSSADLASLAAIARDREEREAQERRERVARAAELLDKPALGFYRRQRQVKVDATGSGQS